MLAQDIHLQRFVEPQTPAGDIPERVAHQARRVLDVDQHLVAVHFAVGGEGADDVKQALAWQTPHRGELAGGRDHHPQPIAAVNAELTGKLFAKDHVVLAGSQIALFDVNQPGREGIFLRRVDTEHHPHRHAARALQHHVTGGDRRHAAYALQLNGAFWQLLRVHRPAAG